MVERGELEPRGRPLQRRQVTTLARGLRTIPVGVREYSRTISEPRPGTGERQRHVRARRSIWSGHRARRRDRRGKREPGHRSLDPTAHAELNAIREACRKLGTFTLQACTLYSSCGALPNVPGRHLLGAAGSVVLRRKRRMPRAPASTIPCLYEQIALPVFERRLRTVRLLDSDGAAPFEAWLQQAGRVPY